MHRIEDGKRLLSYLAGARKFKQATTRIKKMRSYDV